MDRTAAFLAILVGSALCVAGCAAPAPSVSIPSSLAPVTGASSTPAPPTTPTEPSTASPSSAVAEVPLGDIPAGGYDHERFSPHLRLTIESGWHNLASSERDYDRSLFIRRSPEPGGEAIMFDTTKPNFTPRESIDRRLELMPDVETGPVRAITIGGAAGLQVDGLTGKETLIPALSEGYFLSPGDRFRLIALDVAGQTLFIVLEGSSDDWPRFVPIAERVVGSLTFP